MMRLPAGAVLGEQDPRLLIRAELDRALVPGQEMFLVDALSLNAWLDGDSDTFSGESFNQRLFNEDGSFRTQLREGEDYRLLTSTAWRALVARAAEGSSPIPIRRNVIIGSHLAKPEAIVEVYPLNIKLFESSDGRSYRILPMSKTATLRQLLTHVSGLLSIPPHKTLLVVDRDGDNDWKASEAEERGKTLWELRFTPMTRIYGTRDKFIDPMTLKALRDKVLSQISATLTKDLIESVDDTESDAMDVDDEGFDSVWKKQHGNLSRPSASSSYFTRSSTLQSHSSHQNGIVGLSNLGNTCFMNSALQCLSNTRCLTEYFLRKRHVHEVNRSNPLGAKGELADEYADLLKRLWESSSYSMSPSRLYHTVCEFAPQFSGYQQHDSQELIAFFLDGLHEDLNRVTNKPYTQSIEGDGRPDSEVARAAWQLHLARNQSVIVDTFQGQLKSRVECPRCHHVSVTFDPFMYLSLPLPSPMEEIQVVYVPLDRNADAQRMTIRVEKAKTLKAVLEQVSARVKVAPYDLTLAHLNRGGVDKVLEDNTPIRSLSDAAQIHVFEVMQTDFGESDEYYEVVIFSTTRDPRFPSDWVLCADPFFIRVLARKEGFPVTDVLFHGDVLTEISRTVYGVADPNLADRSEDFDVVYMFHGTQPVMQHLDQLGIPPKSRIELRWKSKRHVDNLGRSKKKIVDVDPPVTRRTSQGMELEECLEGFVKPETLGKDNAWFCPKCKEFQQATKKFDIWKTPKILIVHLKRFVYDARNRGKISTSVAFPLENLDLSRFVLGDDAIDSPPPRYNLFAVSDHSGGLGGGHYTAYAKNALDGKWWYFNDTSVSLSSPNEISNSGAYLLFYERIDAPSQAPSAVEADDKMDVVPQSEFTAEAPRRDLENEKD